MPSHAVRQSVLPPFAAASRIAAPEPFNSPHDVLLGTGSASTILQTCRCYAIQVFDDQVFRTCDRMPMLVVGLHEMPEDST